MSTKSKVLKTSRAATETSDATSSVFARKKGMAELSSQFFQQRIYCTFWKRDITRTAVYLYPVKGELTWHLFWPLVIMLPETLNLTSPVKFLLVSIDIMISHKFLYYPRLTPDGSPSMIHAMVQELLWHGSFQEVSMFCKTSWMIHRRWFMNFEKKSEMKDEMDYSESLKTVPWISKAMSMLFQKKIHCFWTVNGQTMVQFPTFMESYYIIVILWPQCNIIYIMLLPHIKGRNFAWHFSDNGGSVEKIAKPPVIRRKKTAVTGLSSKFSSSYRRFLEK